MINLCEGKGWTVEKVLADFPIEWFLMNEHSNYVQDRSTGKAAHASRIFLENFLEDQVEDREALTEFFESMAKIGQGRHVIAFCIRA